MAQAIVSYVSCIIRDTRTVMLIPGLYLKHKDNLCSQSG
jgi:hypothetical protein